MNWLVFSITGTLIMAFTMFVSEPKSFGSGLLYYAYTTFMATVAGVQIKRRIWR